MNKEKAKVKKNAPQEPKSRDERRREYAMARRRKNRIKRIFTGVLFFLFLLAAAVTLCFTVFFKINTITVAGETQYTSEQIIKSSGLTVGEALFGFSAESVSSSITKALPYIGKAEIKRSIPDTVTITVESAAPSCALRTDNGYVLLDDDGKVLEITDSDKDIAVPIIMISGVEKIEVGAVLSVKDESVMNSLSVLVDAAEQAGLDVTYYDLSDSANVLIVCENGETTLKLGVISSDTINRKLLLAGEAIKREKANGNSVKGTFDLTYDGKAYFSPKTEDD